jgi:hypothetical protein
MAIMSTPTSPEEIAAEAELQRLNAAVGSITSSIQSAVKTRNSQAGSAILSQIWDIKKETDAFKKTAEKFHDIWEGVKQLESKLEAEHELALRLVANFTEESKMFMENRRTRYDDAGEWARHYSTVRMTVATFALTTCVAIIALKGDKSSSEGKIYIGNSVAILWLLGVVIFYVFSYLSYRQSNRQRKYRKNLPTSAEDSKSTDNRGFTSMTRDFAWWTVTALTFIFGCFVVTEACQYVWELFKLAIFLLILCGIILPTCLGDWIKKDVWKDVGVGVKRPLLDRVCDVLGRIGNAL